MNSYPEQLLQKTNKYLFKYAGKTRSAALRLLFFNLKHLLGLSEFADIVFSALNKTPRDRLKIAIHLGGGIGDVIIGCLFVKRFAQKLDCSHQLDVFFDQSFGVISPLLENQKYITSFHNIKEFSPYKYDFVLVLDVQFPILKRYARKKVERLSPFLSDYAKKLRRFADCDFPLAFSVYHTFNHQHWLLINGLTRITGMDVYGILGIRADDTLDIPLGDEAATLSKLGLAGEKYITVSRSGDVRNKSANSTRYWDVEKYGELAALLKARYPDLKVVQIGGPNSLAIENTDADFAGKITFAETLVVLKNATLHIDSESGYVHLRHFLSGGCSAVLFGPTAVETRGYGENINIRSSACNCKFCEWINGDKWQTCCPRTQSENSTCMQDISPEFVAEKVGGYLSAQL